jgi:hypothetical protein
MINYMVGVGPHFLFAHDALDTPTHEWLTGDFGQLPMNLCKQWGRSLHAGHVDLPALPESLLDQPPKTDARIVLLAGVDNNFCLPEGQRRTFEWLESMRPGYHGYHEFAGFGHLDLWLGRAAPEQTWPVMLAELERGP